MTTEKKQPGSVTHSEIANAWCQDKKGDVTPDKVVTGSKKKFWWKYEKGPERVCLAL